MRQCESAYLRAFVARPESYCEMWCLRPLVVNDVRDGSDRDPNGRRNSVQRVVMSLLAVALSVGLVEPCTVFKATNDGRTLVGNNEDWEDVPTRVWFLAPQDGAFGRVLFGFINGWAQGGMNDQGLFLDWVAGYTTGWTRSPDLPDFFENISEKILEEASTVDEALTLCASFNIDGFAAARMMLVDRGGRSAIVGFEDGRLRVWRSSTSMQTIGARAETANRMLRAGADISVDGFADILSACRLRGRFQTRYSNIYDLREGEIHVYDVAGNEHGVVLNLKAELDKGNHYYDVAEIADQLMQTPKVDHKTAEAVDISLASAAAISGTYRGSKSTLRAVQITVEDGSLYLWPVAGEARRFRLYAGSEDVFFLRCIAGRFTARRDSDGRITGLLMEQAGHQNMLERIDASE